MDRDFKKEYANAIFEAFNSIDDTTLVPMNSGYNSDGTIKNISTVKTPCSRSKDQLELTTFGDLISTSMRSTMKKQSPAFKHHLITQILKEILYSST